jgi:hypothetical protein
MRSSMTGAHPLEGVPIDMSQLSGAKGVPESWEVSDDDDPGFTVIYSALAGLFPVGSWRADERAITCLPMSFGAYWDQPPAPYCELDLRTESDGRVVCVSLTVHARADDRVRTEVSLAAIRNIRIAELKRRAIRLALVEIYQKEDGTAAIRLPRTGEEKDLVLQAPQAFETLEASAHRPHRGKKLSDAHLREVAKVYRQALKAEKPTPTKAVMQHFFTARPNAGRWVSEARKRGFLGEAEAPRQAGESKRKQSKGGTSRG